MTPTQRRTIERLAARSERRNVVDWLRDEIESERKSVLMWGDEAKFRLERRARIRCLRRCLAAVRTVVRR